MPKSSVVGPVNSFFSLLTPSQKFRRAASFFRMSGRVTLIVSPSFISIYACPRAAWILLEHSSWRLSAQAFLPSVSSPLPVHPSSSSCHPCLDLCHVLCPCRPCCHACHPGIRAFWPFSRSLQESCLPVL